MKKVFVSSMIIITASLLGCSSGGSDPKPALINFMDALNKQDIESAKKYATMESAAVLDMTKSMGLKKDSVGKYDINKLEVGNSKIEGDIAYIPVKIKENGITINYKLKKESGAWKVAFDKSSLMSMGMDAMNQNSDKINMSDSMKAALGELKDLPMDSLKSVMEQLKGVNIDSLKDAMKEGMKVLDSTRHH